MQKKDEMAENGIYVPFERMCKNYRGDVEKESKIAKNG